MSTPSPVREPIAVIGIGCRFPGAASKNEFWDLLARGGDAVTEVPRDRWQAADFFSTERGVAGKTNSRWGGFLPDVAGFDSQFFRVTPTEADWMDPQQRLLLETSYEALRDAGLGATILAGKRVGVFVGISSNDYAQAAFQDLNQINMYSLTGVSASIAANRLSYFYDFRGPSVAIDTACSSSLVATHMACQSLWLGESDLVLAGGVNVVLSPLVGVGFSQAGATSPDGRCKAFAASANGMVRSEGAGVIVLKPLAQALADRDPVYAVIRGSAVTQDGQTNGLTAPNPLSQQAVLRDAYRVSGVAPGAVGYIEAHGTGTILGDPIEAKALGAVIGQDSARRDTCRLGSVKSNCGHLEAAAGIAGLIKVALAMKHGEIPPSLHFDAPNPHIDFASLGLAVATGNEPWPEAMPFAGVSAFGFGGTNAHVVLERFVAPRPAPQASPDQAVLLPVSAHSPEALAETLAQFDKALANGISADVHALASTAQTRGDHWRHRVALVGRDASGLRERIAAVRAEATLASPRKRPRLAFVFSGMGSQQLGMGRSLMKFAAFRDAVERCDQAFSRHLDWSVAGRLEAGIRSDARPEDVQPLLFTFQVALAALWQDWGIVPEAVVGSSMGEVAAAYVAGILSLDDAAKVSARRIQILAKLTGQGGIAVVDLPASELAQVLAAYDDVWISAINGPSFTGIAGREHALEAVLAELTARGRFCRRVIGASTPSHTPLVEPLRAETIAHLGELAPRAGRIPMISSVTGQVVNGATLDATYWFTNMREPIDLVSAIRTLEQTAHHSYVEISPHPVLVGPIKETLGDLGREAWAFASMQREATDETPLLECTGELYRLGFDPTWSAIDQTPPQVATALPGYGWQKEQHWLPEPEAASEARVGLLQRPPSAACKVTGSIGANGGLNADVLRNMDRAEAKEALIAYLRAHVARALKFSPAELNPDEPLKNMGIGSLVGMELYSRLKRELGVALPVTRFLRGPSIAVIADEVLGSLSGAKPTTGIQPVDRQRDDLPLSFPQKRLWFLDRYHPGSSTYNIPIAVKLDGVVRVDALERSLNRIVQRHEVLRTQFGSRQGKPTLTILPKLALTIAHHDLDGSSEAAWRERAKELANVPFSLDQAPLLRADLLSVSADSHVLLLTMHHIIADGWSFGVLLSELQAFYKAELDGSDASLPPLTLQYVDFAEWQAKLLESPALKRATEYWRTRLAGAPALLTLATDRPRPATQTFRGTLLPFSIPLALTERLEELSRREGTTLFVVLMAAYKALLHRLSGMSDIVVGSPIAGRHEPGVENLIGFFLNMLPLRTDVDAGLTMRALIARVRQTTLDAYENQDVPFEKIVEVVNPQRSLAYAPLFQVVLALHAPVEPNSLADLGVTPVDLDVGTAKFDLSFGFMRTETGLRGTIEFSSDLFDQSTIATMAAQFVGILERATHRPDATLAEILDEPARQPAPCAAPSPRASTIVDAFARAVARSPDAPAVRDGELSLTYGELETRANQLAHFLKAWDIGRGDVVAIVAGRSSLAVVAALAVMKTGAAYLPLDPAHPASRLDRQISDAQAKVVLARRDHLEKVSAATIPLICLDDSASDPVDPGPLPEGAKPDDRAYVIYTSGSSGTPKGVEVSHRNLMALVAWHHEAYGITPADRATQIAGPAFDAAVWEVWPYLAAGARLAIPADTVRETPRQLIAWLAREAITVTFLPTPLAESLLAEPWPPEIALRALLTGGDRLTKRPPEGLPFRLFNHYGPTENTVVATSAEVKPASCESGLPTIGRPITGVTVHLLDAERNPVAPGVAGEIFLAGDSVALGYLDRPELTRERFVSIGGERCYRTGDLARWNAEGALEFLGRADRQIKIRGFRIELGEIEAELGLLPGIRQATTMVREDQSGHKLLVAYYVATPDARLHSEDIAKVLSARLPEPMVPSAYVELERLPLTPNGKIDHAALPAPEREQSTEPMSALEAQLAAIWQSVLSIDTVGRRENFFALGGHSLLAMQLITQVSETFGVDLPLKDLFATPTVEALAQKIEAALVESSARPATALPQLIASPATRHEPFPLTDVQAAYWIGRSDSLTLGGVAPHAYLEIDVEHLDEDKLARALGILVKRHDMLRATVDADGRQVIRAEVTLLPPRVTDLTADADDKKARALSELRETLSHRIFSPSVWPLFDIRVTRMSRGLSRVHVSIDGLIADAVSLKILAKELGELYADLSQSGQPASVSFRDYVLLEREIARSPRGAEAKAYWSARLEALPPRPDLPLAPQATGERERRFARLAGRLNREQWRRFKTHAASHSLTPSAALLGAFSEVLARWSRTQHFTINLTLFNRLPVHPDVARMVGDFTTLSLLEIDAREGQTLARHAALIQARLSEDLEHRYAGGIWVMREIARRHGPDAARFPVVFTSLVGDEAATGPMTTLGKVTHAITQTPQVWLDHQVFEDDGELCFHWDHPEALFPEGMLEAMFEAYRNVLDCLADEAAVWENVIAVEGPAPVSIGETRPAPTRLLHEPLDVWAERHPDHPAVVTATSTMSYRTLARRVNALATRLREAGAQPNELVAVVLEKGWEQVVATLAIMKAGAAYMPLSPDYPDERLSRLIARGGARHVVTTTRHEGRVSSSGKLTLHLVGEEESWSALPSVNAPTDLAYVIFTSGSTGEPKGVMIDHQGAMNTIEEMNRRFGITRHDRVFALSELTFDLSVFDIVGTLTAGGTIVMPRPGSQRDPAHWSALVNQAGVTVWNSVPALMKMFVEHAEGHPERFGTTLAKVFLSGDWVPLDLAKQIRRYAPSCRVVSLGGATEASIWSNFHDIQHVDPAWTSIPYGRALANQSLHVLDERGRPCPVWTTGHLFIGGMGVAQGYWRDPALTAASFVTHPVTGERLYRTGDLARFMASGEVEFLGRDDFQVKIQGYRIELGEIEAALLTHPVVKACAVVAQGEARSARRLVAFFTPRSDAFSEAELMAHLNARLPAYMVPSELFTLATLPLTANGKVDRGALAKQRGTIISSLKVKTKPEASSLAGAVTAIVTDVLELESIDLSADLISQGANSIHIVRLANRLETKFGVCPDMNELFRIRTVHDLVAYYETLGIGVTEAKPAKRAELLDPSEREAFKKAQPALRTLTGEVTELARTSRDTAGPRELRSSRVFQREAVTATQLARLLEALAEVTSEPSESRRSYASAGALYPVQAYVHVTRGGVEGLAPGAYYYHPLKHALAPISDAELPVDAHFFMNHAVAAEAKFTICLVGHLGAIEPIYGSTARDYCLIEAGAMAQALRAVAPQAGLGLCPIGQMDAQVVAKTFQLGSEHALLHSLIGGSLENESAEANVRLNVATDDGASDEWEEIRI